MRPSLSAPDRHDHRRRADSANIASGSILYTFRSNETVTGFDAADIAVSDGGTRFTFTAVDGDTYTLEVTPMTDFQGPLVVGVGLASPSTRPSTRTRRRPVGAGSRRAASGRRDCGGGPDLLADETSLATITFTEKVTH